MANRPTETDSTETIRAGLIEIRDNALRAGVFSDSVLLSHAIAHASPRNRCVAALRATQAEGKWTQKT